MTLDAVQLEEYEALVQFLYLAPIGIVQTAADGDIIMVNPISAQLLMQLSADGMASNLFDALEGVLPDLRQRVAQFQGSYGMVCDSLRMPAMLGGKVERDRRVFSLSVLKLDANRLMAVMSDITEAEKRERQLRESEAWFRAIVTGVTDYALMAIDDGGRVLDWNASIRRVTGFTAEQVIGQSYGMFYQQDAISDQLMLDRLSEADAQGWSLDEGWRQRADGTRFWGSSLIAPLHISRDAEGKAAAVLPTEGQERSYSLILRDISEQRDSHEALRRSVNCDHLTGLLNRRAFYDAAQTELQRWARTPRHLSVAIFDADHFKRINDTYGHHAGDAVLRHLAAALTAGFRELDVISRIGGEEFVVLLPGTSLESAIALAQRACTHLATRPAHWQGEQIACSVSVGVAEMQSDVPDFDALMMRADRALYAAKAAGRNCVMPWSEPLSVSR